MSMWIHIIFLLLYIYAAIGTVYIAVFAIASRCRRKETFDTVPPRYRFLLLFPSYKEDSVICESVQSAMRQDYPADLYHVCVIADRMQEETLKLVQDMHAEAFPIHCEQSSKAKALTLAMDHFSTEQKVAPYDFIIVLDADNVIPTDYLTLANNYLAATDERIVQTHRTAKNRNTPTAILDAAIEEMNNSIFRAGHVRLGISSSLIGSGMIMDYNWFHAHIRRANTVGEDKELEEMLLRERIHIGYTAHILVYDEKVQKPSVMRQQRKRWIATQYSLAKVLLSRSPEAIRKGNIDYLLKTIETLMPPRSILLVLVTVWALVASFVQPLYAGMGWGLWLLLLLSMHIAIPREIKDKHFWMAIRYIPYFVASMASNLINQRGAKKTFIHTRHG